MGKLIYQLYQATETTFPEMVDQVLSHINREICTVRLIFFDAPSNQSEYILRKEIITDKIKKSFDRFTPAFSYISQKPLNAPLVLETQAINTSPNDRIEYRRSGETNYVIIENDSLRFIFAGGINGNLHAPISVQANEVFMQIETLLQKEGFSVNQIIRQWNYIENITGFEDNHQHYQIFNNARSGCYKKVKWYNGFPAATGIGTDLGGILVDIDAVVLKKNNGNIKPIDNKLQIAAHAYSNEVLRAAHHKKTTPKFERAKCLNINRQEMIYISGTAAIRGEKSLKDVKTAKQLQITMENIAELIDDARLQYLRVYMKFSDNYEEIADIMHQYYPDIPISYMRADVCRDELMIEIEGVAIK